MYNLYITYISFWFCFSREHCLIQMLHVEQSKHASWSLSSVSVGLLMLQWYHPLSWPFIILITSQSPPIQILLTCKFRHLIFQQIKFLGRIHSNHNYTHQIFINEWLQTRIIWPSNGMNISWGDKRTLQILLLKIHLLTCDSRDKVIVTNRRITSEMCMLGIYSALL